MTTPAQIMVVDDDKEDQFIFLEYFTDAGNQDKVSFFDNGIKVLEHLNSLALSQLPNLIVLDLNMPIMTGTQVLIELKKSTGLKHIPVMIFSTSENEIERRKCLSLGAVDYLVKPYGLEQGMAIMEKFNRYIKS